MLAESLEERFSFFRIRHGRPRQPSAAFGNRRTMRFRAGAIVRRRPTNSDESRSRTQLAIAVLHDRAIRVAPAFNHTPHEREDFERESRAIATLYWQLSVVKEKGPLSLR